MSKYKEIKKTLHFLIDRLNPKALEFLYDILTQWIFEGIRHG